MRKMKVKVAAKRTMIMNLKMMISHQMKKMISRVQERLALHRHQFKILLIFPEIVLRT
jgi:hypothetical protein